MKNSEKLRSKNQTDLIEAKARAYDILVQLEQLQRKLKYENNIISLLSKEAAENKK